MFFCIDVKSSSALTVTWDTLLQWARKVFNMWEMLLQRVSVVCTFFVREVFVSDVIIAQWHFSARQKQSRLWRRIEHIFVTVGFTRRPLLSPKFDTTFRRGSVAQWRERLDRRVVHLLYNVLNGTRQQLRILICEFYVSGLTVHHNWKLAQCCWLSQCRCAILCIYFGSNSFGK